MTLQFLGPAGLGGVFMAYLGWARARRESVARAIHEKPPEPALPPAHTPAQHNIAQIGGLVMSYQTMESLISAVNKLAVAHEDKTELCRTMHRQRLEEGVSNRQHERAMVNQFGGIMSELTNSLRALKS